jgi:hypothetical protein
MLDVFSASLSSLPFLPITLHETFSIKDGLQLLAKHIVSP